jgi:transposase
MLKNLQQFELQGWARRTSTSGIRELRRFAQGLEQDWEAVQAALATRYSNGMVEGHINRLKMLKRQMNGRASLALLRIRVLYGQMIPSTAT